MRPLLLLVILGSSVLVALVIHIFRDVRGKARNLRGACYSCGTTESDLHAVIHTAGLYGVAYLYCARCATRQTFFKVVATSIAISVGAVTMAVISLSIIEANPLGAISLAGGSLLAFLLVLHYIWRHASPRARARFRDDMAGLNRYIRVLRLLKGG